MTTRAFLNQINQINLKLQVKFDEYQQTEAILTKITVSLEGERVKSTPDPDKMTAIIAKLIEEEEEIKDALENMMNLKKTIRSMIEGIEVPRYQAFLSYKYIQGLDMKEIGYKLNLSSTPTFNLQTEALIAFEEKYGPKYLTTADVMEKYRKKYRTVEKSSKE